MQTKEIKLNISYIVLGLLAFILLFTAFTSTAHAQASTTPGVVSALTQITVDDETFQVKPLILDEMTNFTIRGLGPDESFVIFRFMHIDAAGEFTDAEAIVRKVTKTQMKEINGVWVWSTNLNFLEEGVHQVVLEIKSDITISYINVSAPPEAVSVEKLVSEVEKRGFFARFWRNLTDFFRGEPLVEKKVIEEDCCQLIQDEIDELELSLEENGSLTQSVIDGIGDDIAALERTKELLGCKVTPPTWPPIDITPIRLPVIGDIGLPGTGTGTDPGTTVNPDGTTTTITTDAGGTITTIDYPNGTSVTIGSDGTITWTFGDGTVKIENPDGSWSITDSNDNLLYNFDPTNSSVITVTTTTITITGGGEFPPITTTDTSTDDILVGGVDPNCSLPQSLIDDLQDLAAYYSGLATRPTDDTEANIDLLAEGVANFPCGCGTEANNVIDTINDGAASHGDINTALNDLLGCL